MGADSPFGQPVTAPPEHKPWTTIPLIQQIDDELPWLGQATHTIKYIAMPIVREFISASAPYQAPALVFSQAFNDWMELLDEVLEGAGRPATRTARALVEHAINMADVSTSPGQAERYMDHLVIVAELQQNARIGLSKLNPKARRSVARKLEREARQAERKITEAVSRYGPSWKRSWASENLYDRASRLNLVDLYDYYRIASLVMHGAAGGSLGTRATIDGHTVHRTGPAIDLCPMAYFEGNRAFLSILDSAATVRADMDFSDLRNAVQELLDGFDDVRSAFVKIDEQTWPRTSPAEPHSVVAIARNGQVRWYWHEPIADLLFEAEQPTLADKVQRALDQKVDDIVRSPDQYIHPGFRWVAGVFGPPALSPPRAGGWAVPAASVLAAGQEDIAVPD
ncbi:DUF5677 domain-containing protein [Jiangella alkaliphila]|uniref:Uncharacterized protein n=1 Tax=Jiangella alkaliphila TaxID=419479 RepID=A0A1H2LNK2_9ACTN|nr:DUF5677 domain-containing protein [Jiangella alkaliphila]SDU82583.1 hypothetical protein SAMN04488563_6440 [Jiangella alkaliphila]